MAAVAERYANHVVVTNDNPRTENATEIIEQIEQGFSANKHHIIEDREAAIRFAILQAKVGDMIVVAGKGHEAYQLIGNQKIAFSDQKIAHAALKDREVSHD
jgi:UDP-N-acetylmuramoyl-L-alanyl-D-glutamate--2,6-diaminopimelate ligase